MVKSGSAIGLHSPVDDLRGRMDRTSVRPPERRLRQRRKCPRVEWAPYREAGPDKQASRCVTRHHPNDRRFGRARIGLACRILGARRKAVEFADAPWRTPPRALHLSDPWVFGRPTRPARSGKIGRNDPCPCGFGRKYKKCCYGESVVAAE
ncbi:MAG: SEC-C domain-containing protein [Methylobacteriaceae bacterium]|nr:SEC-C domain-containing protein [Methylobacteriaceae bacterium]